MLRPRALKPRERASGRHVEVNWCEAGKGLVVWQFVQLHQAIRDILERRDQGQRMA
jgi:hypothetical protein